MILAIDPGTTHSAYVVFDPNSNTVPLHAKIANADMLAEIGRVRAVTCVVVERVMSYGMPVGAEIFDTVEWCGQFRLRASQIGIAYHRMSRKAVVSAVCNSARAKDPHVRQAMIDRWGGKEKAIGNKAKPGPLYGIIDDEWQALGLAVAFAGKSEE